MITAAHLVAGTIASEQGNFFINLDGGTIDTSATGSTYKNSDYSQADLDRVNQINVKAVTPTLADYEKLDVDGDGTISITDAVQILQIINGKRNFTTWWRLRIDPADGNNLLKVYRVYHNNLTNTDTENVVLSAGFSNVKVNSLEASNVTATGAISAGGAVEGKAGRFDSLTVNGSAYQPFQKKTIGYVVFCSATSGNQVSCFIPAGRSGSYQCASDDWYCAFTFDGQGTASKIGGTGDVVDIVAISNG